MLLRLADQYDHLWAFASVEGMDLTSNMAERDLRKLVVWRKEELWHDGALAGNDLLKGLAV